VLRLTTLAILAAAAISTAATDTERHATASGPPDFESTTSKIDGHLRGRMTGKSWHRGCPVPLSKLRLVTLRYWGFDREPHHGDLVVHGKSTDAITKAMRSLYEDRFPIRRMKLIDAYGADDHRSMHADNTSAFNCRFVAGRPGVWSQHAFGRAIDINPVENPYVTRGGHVSPPNGRRFANRSRHARGMIHRGDATVNAFARVGWEWLGRGHGTRDFQHFSANGH
jgi:hypothetical protein